MYRWVMRVSILYRNRRSVVPCSHEAILAATGCGNGCRYRTRSISRNPTIRQPLPPVKHAWQLVGCGNCQMSTSSASPQEAMPNSPLFCCYTPLVLHGNLLIGHRLKQRLLRRLPVARSSCGDDMLVETVHHLLQYR
jgi:hypothetical protein